MPYYVELPQFVGNEREQLAQMRSYLYRQADQLRFALNDLEKYHTDIDSKTNNANADGKIATDHVVEQGKSGGWNYRKWRSGNFEAFGTFDVTPTASEQMNTLYRSGHIEVTLPFAIGTDTVVYGTVSGGYWLGDSNRSGDYSIAVRIMSDDTINTAESVTLRLHVEGTLKTED